MPDGAGSRVRERFSETGRMSGMESGPAETDLLCSILTAPFTLTILVQLLLLFCECFDFVVVLWGLFYVCIYVHGYWWGQCTYTWKVEDNF